MSKTTQFFILTVQNNSLEKNLMVLFLIWSIIRLLLNPFRLFRSFRSFRLFRSFRFVLSNIISQQFELSGENAITYSNMAREISPMA